MNQIASALASGTTTYFQPPDPTPALAISNEKKIQRRLAILVGCVAFGLPIVMMIGTFYGNTCFRQSISHYYYAQFLGTLFVGMLVFIGGFLIAYTAAATPPPSSPASSSNTRPAIRPPWLW